MMRLSRFNDDLKLYISIHPSIDFVVWVDPPHPHFLHLNSLRSWDLYARNKSLGIIIVIRLWKWNICQFSFLHIMILVRFFFHPFQPFSEIYFYFYYLVIFFFLFLIWLVIYYIMGRGSTQTEIYFFFK